MDNSSQGSAFITEVDSTRKQLQQHTHVYHDTTGLLDQCRKDYGKIKEVVSTFSSKVETLIDKQRHEYIQAYENHMSDVQKELHQLREKVAEIANDETKNEKTASLKQEQSMYKAEALRLLGDSDDCRKRIRSLVKQTYSLEKTRDWMLEKLRQAKKEFVFLTQERTRVFEDLDLEQDPQDGMSLGHQSLFGGNSSYSLQLEKEAVNRIGKSKRQGPGGESKANLKTSGDADWDSKLALLTVSRNNGSQPLLPLFPSTPNSAINQSAGSLLGGSKANKKPYPDPISLITQQIALPVAASEIGGNNSASHAKSQLISARTRQAELRGFLNFCATSLHRPPWCRVQKRPYEQLLADCMQQLSEVAPRHFSSNKMVLQLACELAAHPQTYGAILQVIDPLHQNLQGHRSAADTAPGMLAGADSEFDAEDGEDLELEYSFGNSHSHLEVSGFNVVTNAEQEVPQYADLEASLLRPPTTPKQVAELKDFKDKISSLLRSSVNTASATGRTKQMLDDDLVAYLSQERNNKSLRDMGYFNKDDFLNFS